MSLTLSFDPHIQQLGLVGPSLTFGLELARHIVSTGTYCNVLIENIADNGKPSAADVQACIAARNVIISIIQVGEHMDAYAVVYRAQKLSTIFINPLLLMQIRLMEIQGSSPNFLRKCSLFIAVKVVHALSQLIQPEISPRLRNQVKKRALGGEGKLRMQTPEKSKGGAIFSDFGQMIEHDIFGGIVDIYTRESQPVAFLIDELILYEHPTARSGRLVQVKASDYTVTEGLADLVLRVGESVDEPYRGPRGHVGVPPVTLSGPANAAESDVIDEPSAELMPTF